MDCEKSKRSAISPRNSLTLFHFFGTDALYQDPVGRRVIADAEGSGWFRVLKAETSLHTFRDSVAGAEFPPEFTSSLSVLAEGPGEVNVLVGHGSPPVGGLVEAVGEGTVGVGWVVSSDGPIEVDGAGEIVLGEGVPFFRSVRGAGVRVIREPYALVSLDLVSVTVPDAKAAREWKAQNLSRARVLASHFANGTPHEAPVASMLNACHFTVTVPASAVGIQLRKTYDRFHGLQRVRVLADSQFVGWWYSPFQNRTLRWAVSTFGFDLPPGPARHLRITLDPPAGAPLWSWSEIEVSALLKI